MSNHRGTNSKECWEEFQGVKFFTPFTIMQPRNPYLENMRIQRQKGCLYVCGVKFETPIDKMRTSVNAGNNILCPHEPEAPKELDGGNFLVKVVIPARLKNVIMKQLEEKGITKEALLPM